jgi:hypothetical protein
MHNIKNCLERNNESGVFVEIIQAFKLYGNNESTGGAALCRHFLTFGDKASFKSNLFTQKTLSTVQSQALPTQKI